MFDAALTQVGGECCLVCCLLLSAEAGGWTVLSGVLPSAEAGEWTVLSGVLPSAEAGGWIVLPGVFPVAVCRSRWVDSVSWCIVCCHLQKQVGGQCFLVCCLLPSAEAGGWTVFPGVLPVAIC